MHKHVINRDNYANNTECENIIFCRHLTTLHNLREPCKPINSEQSVQSRNIFLNALSGVLN